MKERPILFSAPMVRALLAGTKTQTRRVAKGVAAVHSRTGEALAKLDSAGPRVACPYGQPQDLLIVRETWMPDPPRDGTWPHTAFDGCKPHDMSLIPERYRSPEHCLYRADGHKGLTGWTPAIHMFRWASRITLEITGLRVERLQDISEADALAEGITAVREDPSYFGVDGLFLGLNARESYAALWDSINGAGSCDANPWVWVVEFNRVTP